MGDLNHYEWLGVDRNATTAEIRIAYKKQSLALHPDKNPHGANLMKSVNAAWAILKDETERRKYDREISLGGGRNTNRYSYDDVYYEEQIRFLERQLRNSTSKNQALEQQLRNSTSKNQSLEQKLRNSTSKNRELRDHLNDKNKALADVKASSKSLGKKLKQLESKHTKTEAQCKQSNERVNYYISENIGLQQSLNMAHDENGGLRDELDIHEAEKEKAAKTLKKEKQKFEDTLAAEKEKATEQMEQMKMDMLARSICYTCNGDGGNDCITCKGQGSVQGKWTRCHNCKGTGSFTSLHGEGKSVECLACFGKGAKEGVFQITCFKCKGDRKKKIYCNTCHKGKIRGFSLKSCPFCNDGNGCMNCLGKGHVLCGHLCNGKVPPSPSSLQIALKKEVEGDDWIDRFMESANGNYTYYANEEWEECRSFVSMTDYDANEEPSADVDEAKESFGKFNINSSQVSFNMGFNKGGNGGSNNRKGKKKERASGQRKSSTSSPTSVLFSSAVKLG